MRKRFDIIVIGAGPAGSLTAMILARQGCRVAVFDRKRSGSFLVGETLPPQASRLLADLGLLKRFVSQGHRRSPGIVSAWGSADPLATDYLFSANGDGWHIDRSAFNQLLREAAIGAGATLFKETSIEACVPSGSGWTLHAGGSECDCQILVDAAGRHPSSKLPHPSRIVYDRLISIVGLTRANGDGGHAPSDYTLVESVKDGWFYSALMPSGNYIVTFTTDADVYATGRTACSAYLDEELCDAPLTRARIQEFPKVTKAFSAVTMRRKIVAETNWIAVGDAARSYDPLSGLGVWNAMNGALKAAPVIQGMRRGQPESVEGYNTKHRKAFASYWERHAAYYALENRWPESPFWARRHRGLERRDFDSSIHNMDQEASNNPTQKIL
jgi:flavin-dependent dehydrogenase